MSRSAAGQPDRELRLDDLAPKSLARGDLGERAAARLSCCAKRGREHDQSLRADLSPGGGRAGARRDRDPGPDGEALTYGDLDERCARLAARLARLGVGRGDRVAAQIEKSVTNALLYLACLRLGAVYLPLNTAYTEGELAYFFGDAEPALIVCDPARRAATLALGGAARVATLDAAGAGDLVEDLEGEAPHGAIAAVADDDLAALLYTSGTTGRSKGAMLTPWQSRLQCAHARGRVGLLRCRRAPARPAAVPRARPVRRLQHGAARGRAPAVPAALRCRAGARAAAARDRDDGRADLLHPPARPGRAVAPRAAPGCACSSRARRRCSRTPSCSSRRAPGSASSSATA